MINLLSYKCPMRSKQVSWEGRYAHVLLSWFWINESDKEVTYSFACLEKHDK